MNKHYKHLSSTLVPSDDGEERVEIHLYQIDEEENDFLHDVQGFQNNPEYAPVFGDGNDAYYCQDIKDCGTVRNAVAEALNLVEEPDYAVPPGGIYHRYEVYLMWGVVAVCETIALNI